MISARTQTVRRLALTWGSAAAFAPAALLAQSSYTAPVLAMPYFNRNVIVLDPAHGGQDNGPTLNGQPEKAITLALGASLRAALVSRGFTVVSTREADLPEAAPNLTTDQRTGTANHLRPAACIILHATENGTGVHIFTSSLSTSEPSYEPSPTPTTSPTSTTIPWETAQTGYLPQSQRLANDLGLALLHARVPVLLSRAALRPLDNLTCPALAVEIAPLAAGNGNKPAHVTDTGYQQRVADTLAAAILTWRDLISPRPTPKPTQTPVAASGVNP